MNAIRLFGLAAAVTFTGLPAANADQIRIGNQLYENVLVDKGATTYYVRIPNEGTIIIVPEREVDASTIKRNEDPFYREDLRERYEQVRADSGAENVGGRVFSGGLADAGGGDVDINSLLGGGGGGGNLQLGGPLPLMAPQQLVAMTANFGINFQSAGSVSGQPAQRASLPGGAGTITIVGPDDQLLGLVIEAQGPEQALPGGLQQLGPLLGPLGQPVQQALAEAQQSGSSSKTASNAKINVTWQASGGNATAKIQIVGS